MEKANALETQATAEIKKLNAAKSLKATRLQNAFNRLQQLTTRLKNETNKTTIRRLVIPLKFMVTKMELKLRLLKRRGNRKTAAPLVKRDEKDPLVAALKKA